MFEVDTTFVKNKYGTTGRNSYLHFVTYHKDYTYW